MIVVRSTGKSVPRKQRIKRTWSWLRCHFAFPAFTFAHLAFCAALIAARPAALILRFFWEAGSAAATTAALPFTFAHLAF